MGNGHCLRRTVWIHLERNTESWCGSSSPSVRRFGSFAQHFTSAKRLWRWAIMRSTNIAFWANETEPAHHSINMVRSTAAQWAFHISTSVAVQQRAELQNGINCKALTRTVAQIQWQIHTHSCREWEQRDEHQAEWFVRNRNNTLVAPDDTTAILLYVLSTFYFPFIPFHSVRWFAVWWYCLHPNLIPHWMALGTAVHESWGNTALFSIRNAVDMAWSDACHRKSTNSAGWHGFCARIRSRLKSPIELFFGSADDGSIFLVAVAKQFILFLSTFLGLWFVFSARFYFIELSIVWGLSVGCRRVSDENRKGRRGVTRTETDRKDSRIHLMKLQNQLETNLTNDGLIDASRK